MRLLIDSLIAVMLIGILAAVVLHHRHAQQQVEQYVHVHETLAALREQALYQAALREAAGEEKLYPPQLDREWFGPDLPVNTIAPAHHPWIDVAPAGDTEDHPPDPVLISPEQAGLWYNPTLGVFRARVPDQRDADETLTLYNRLNGTSLLALPTSDDAMRTPERPDWGAVYARPRARLPVIEGLPPPPPAPVPEPESEPEPERVRRSLFDRAPAEE